MTYVFWQKLCATSLIFLSLLTALWTGAAQAQGGTPAAGRDALDGAMVTINEGTCESPNAQALMELGAPKHHDVSPTEDQNGNGILDQGEDTNGNGTLDRGSDANHNDVLDSDEIVPGVGQDPNITNVSDIWTLESDAQVDPFQLFEQDNVILVRTAGDAPQTLACGVLRGVVHEDNRQPSVSLNPGSQGQYNGLVTFGTDPAPAEGETLHGVQVTIFAIPEGTPPPAS